MNRLDKFHSEFRSCRHFTGPELTLEQLPEDALRSLLRVEREMNNLAWSQTFARGPAPDGHEHPYEGQKQVCKRESLLVLSILNL
jgi:hypothetical protein